MTVRFSQGATAKTTGSGGKEGTEQIAKLVRDLVGVAPVRDGIAMRPHDPRRPETAIAVHELVFDDPSKPDAARDSALRQKLSALGQIEGGKPIVEVS